MEKEDNYQKLYYVAVTRQRNFFAGCMGLLIIANFLLIGRLAAVSEKIIMVPGITQDLAVEGAAVSRSYLEETALLFASALLDLTEDTVDLKKNIILKHASNRSDKNLKALQQYFAVKQEEHKKFKLSTSFAIKKMYIDTRKLQVIIEGVLTSTFGKRGFEQNNVKYVMTFDYIGGHLRIKQFAQIKPEDKDQKNDENV